MKKILSLTLVIVALFSVVWTSGCVKTTTQRTTYDISVTYSDGEILGSETVVFFNDTESSIKELKFNLYANAFRESAKYPAVGAQYTSMAYYKDINYGHIEIKSVKSQGNSLQFSVCGQDENILNVTLDREVFPNEKVSVTIEYYIKVANVIARTGVNRHTVNLANFYPVLCAFNKDGFYECLYYSYGDPYYSECADYKVNVTLDKEYTVASSGQFVSESVNGQTATKTYKIDNARSFALVLSREFECITDKQTGIEINYYFYDDQTPTATMETAIKSIKLFTEKFGEYPYPTYSIVQTEFVQGGMEFPALVMISDSLEKNAYNEVVVHETAHQWWQTAVGNNEIEHGFLDEGLAEYSVVVFYENYPEYNMERDALITASEKTYKTYCTVFDKLFGGANTAMNRSLKDFKGEYEYVNLAYVKPCIMYDYLRKTIGDNKFFGGLKKYYSEYKFKNATPDDLVGVFERQGSDTNGFFKSFFEGKVVI